MEFWSLTPYEFTKVVNGYVERQKALRDNDVTMAYMNAYFQRVNKMPKLKDFLSTAPPKKEQTAVDMLEMIKRINSMAGGEVT